MRINKYVAQATGMSRRAADTAIADGRVLINQQTTSQGQDVHGDDKVYLDNKLLRLPVHMTVILNKPVGYVTSREGQGSKTVYELLPSELHNLKPVGRLDKDSSGLLLLTNDGQLAQRLTHPSFEKEKVYQVVLDKPLSPSGKIQIEQGITLDDGPSKLKLHGNGKNWMVTISEGRNRQIRRTFSALNYTVKKLHRVAFGDYYLKSLASGQFKEI